MWAKWLLFFFVAFGAKALLALVTIYYIFPSERSCPECDGDTLPLRMSAPGRLAARLMRGRIGRRWCPRCGWDGMVRTELHDPAAPEPAAGRPRRARR
jgi:hypothetical protein